MFSINYYFIIVGVIAIVLLIAYYIYIKPVVLESKQLDLKMKSPVFAKLNQAVSGLTQIQIFGRLKNYFNEINLNINDSFKANMFYWFSSRVLGVYVSLIVCVAILIGTLIGVANIDPLNTGSYAVSVTFFVICLDYLQWCFRNLINAESMMVSVSRCFNMIEIKH